MYIASSQYIFDNATKCGPERLRHIEQSNAPYTFEKLEKIGIASGRACLEIGAGSGSVAAWMAKREDRFVPAFDKPTRARWEYDGTDEEFRAGENWRNAHRRSD